MRTPARRLDANTRVGSGGLNAQGDTRIITGLGYSRINGNDIVTGNVTGLGYFHGNIPYAGQRDFRGNLGSAFVDPFIGRSTGSPVLNQGPTVTMTPEPFYGNRTVAPPPAGFVEKGYTGTYTPPPPSYLQPQQYTGVPLNAGLLLSPSMGEFSVPGPIDPHHEAADPAHHLAVAGRADLDRRRAEEGPGTDARQSGGGRAAEAPATGSADHPQNAGRASAPRRAAGHGHG